ncbi:hypothetical protein PIB30_030954 [Stylosanthes scabra]|uniref:Uncharacterized protein n=1 Tax=Stylosanthes scabra TaxID=79078 RepID=A0ABU6SBQ7_9FABA|nr:hypothetical protein [Stylosanthes scabra]
MAKHFEVAVAVLVVAFCFSSVSWAAPEAANKWGDLKNYFSVMGKIYCDPCRVEFDTPDSRPLKVVMTYLECHKADNENNITYRVSGETDVHGFYDLPVSGDRVGEICTIRTDKSKHPKCAEPMKNNPDKIIITKDDGVTTEKHYVRPIGFMTPDIERKCSEL